ncbi:YXWGXW repeat-containing protein [Comamonas terrigena]|uniref:YXWGXW repeat-containing protein n=1 Tax=Comamonas terrigena TaxID=32013 RepID=UPI002447046F|nr:YXWGXW repeat-containing protein [Comamonas terrigena]MDH1701179.1 YXWGXW repeat-containing protein [Comamonas terrigena]
MTHTVVFPAVGPARHAAQPAGRVLAVLAAAVGAAVLTGCVVPPVDGGYGYGGGGYYDSSTVVYTQYGSPPPPRVEYRTVSPYPDYVWVGGDWFWGGSRYDWRPGRWEPPHRAPLWREPARPGWGVPPPPRPGFQEPPPRPRPERPGWGVPSPSRPGFQPPPRPQPPPERPQIQPPRPGPGAVPVPVPRGSFMDRLQQRQERHNEVVAPAPERSRGEDRRGFRDRDRD